MKIDILGTKYDVEFLNEKDSTMIDTKSYGYCDNSTKEIKILKNVDGNLSDLSSFVSNAIRHELIHAYLFESGIDYDYLFHNEDMVNWLALQIVKMNESINKCEKVYRDSL